MVAAGGKARGRGEREAAWPRERVHGTRRHRRPTARLGALLSFELLLVLPIVAVLCFAVTEFSFLLMGMQRVEAASSAACRVATLPSNDPDVLAEAMKEAASLALLKAKLVQSYQIQYTLGQYAGDPVTVEVRVPMKAAAPDLLKVFGVGLDGHDLVARTVMRKQ